MNIKIFVTDLTEYTNGRLIGMWFDMLNYENLDDMLKRCNIPSTHEWFISDYYDRCYDCGEYPDVQDLENLHELALSDNEDISDFFEVYDLNTVINHIDDLYLIKADSESDLAYEIVEEMGLLDGVCETIQSYFDYDAFGRDLVLSGDYTQTANGFVNRI